MAARLSRSAVERFLTDVEVKIAKKILPRVRAACESETLRRALTIRLLQPGRTVVIGVPHYWAPFYHDDRGPVTPRTARFLVWFTNPKDDPRIRGGYPVTRAQIRRLTQEDFQFGLEMNRKVFAEGGTVPFMVVARRVGPRKGKFFFVKGFQGADTDAHDVVARDFDRFVRSVVPTEKATAVMRL